MTGAVGMAVGAYVVLVLVVGAVASRTSGRSPEDYFLAGRRLGRLVLFMALFGTNATPFVLVGIPGQSYRDGVGIFGLNAPIIALGIPLTFWAIGSPARAMGRRLGALTPAELHARRFGSRALGAVLFLFFTVYTVPYMVSGVKGAATTLHVVTDGAVPLWAGGLGVIAVALTYTALGGMAATAWTNVLQGALFLGFMMAAFVLVSSSMGGLAAATEAVRAHDPGLLMLGDSPRFTPKSWATYGAVLSLTVIAFPHMFVRLMAAADDRAVRSACRLYPLALAALWLPAVMLGVWGAAEFPGLEQPDQIYSRMITSHMSPALAAVGFVAVLAAVMSTLDAQILTLSSMLVRDVLPQRASGAPSLGDVRAGRLFSIVVAVVVYALSLTWGQSVFQIAFLAFSGYVTLVPTLLLTVRWRRFTARAAIASIVAGNAVFVAGELGAFDLHGYPAIFWGVLTGLVVAVVVALADRPADAARTRAAFGS